MVAKMELVSAWADCTIVKYLSVLSVLVRCIIITEFFKIFVGSFVYCGDYFGFFGLRIIRKTSRNICRLNVCFSQVKFFWNWDTKNVYWRLILLLFLVTFCRNNIINSIALIQSIIWHMSVNIAIHISSVSLLAFFELSTD